ncbi:MAG: hypothetical protein AAFV95_15235 [Bacteroidota bacterium]
MKNSRLWKVLSCLETPEHKKIRKFITSTYYNQRADLLQLLELLLPILDLPEDQIPSKEQIFQQLYPDQGCDLTRLRLLMSYLLKLVEQFLALQELEADPPLFDNALIQALRKRNLPKEAQRVLKRSQDTLDKQKVRNEQYWNHRHHLNWQRYQLESTQKPLAALNLRAVSESAAIAHCATQLRLAYLSLAHQRVFQQANITTDLAEELLQSIHRYQWLDQPLIRLYYNGYLMLKITDEEKYFLDFKEVLIDQGQHFPLDEIRDLYLGAINFCIRQVNNGHWDERYFVEVLELYKEGLQSEYLLESGRLSRFTYYNIVVAALKVGEYDWTEQFIDQYRHTIEKGYRKSYYSFNKARLEYARQNYDIALEQLQNFAYREPLLNLAARVISIKIYYETNEWDLLESQLEAMKNYLRRKQLIGYHRELFRSFIRYTRRLLSINRYDKAAVEAFRLEIRSEENLTEKEWFLQQLAA